MSLRRTKVEDTGRVRRLESGICPAPSPTHFLPNSWSPGVKKNSLQFCLFSRNSDTHPTWQAAGFANKRPALLPPPSRSASGPAQARASPISSLNWTAKCLLGEPPTTQLPEPPAPSFRPHPNPTKKKVRGNVCGSVIEF